VILSRKWRFLFIKTRKVGGTSVEIALSPLCGPEDIVTPITPIDEYARLARGGRSRNYAADPGLERWYRDQVRQSEGRLGQIPDVIKARQVFYNHMSYSRIRALVPHALDGCLRFTVERHPYEKVVSLADMPLEFHAVLRGEGARASRPELEQAIAALFGSGRVRRVRNFDLYAENGRPAADRVLRHERLREDLGEVLRELGIEAPLDLPAAKTGGRDRSVPAADLLTVAQKRRVQALCREEFELMGYEA
jgi:hypothetical protein